MTTTEAVGPRIVFLQGRAIILDVDLARIHQVPVRQLRELVRQRFENFPGDLCFQIEPGDFSHEAGGEPPFAFTERGAWMAAAVLGGAPGILLTLELSRAFDRFRQGPRMQRPAAVPLGPA